MAYRLVLAGIDNMEISQSLVHSSILWCGSPDFRSPYVHAFALDGKREYTNVSETKPYSK